MKVIVRVKGGLGNQLFCYAAARRLAIANNAELVIDDFTGFVRDSKYRRSYALDRFHIPVRKATPGERMEPFEKHRRGMAKIMARLRPFHLRHYVEQEGNDFDQRVLEFKVKGTVYLDGYWQSEDYFKDFSDVIRKDLTIIPPTDAPNLNMAEHIRECNAVAVHVRFFEDPGNNRGLNLGKQYYVNATKEIMSRVREPHFFLFSDQPDKVRQMLAIPDDSLSCVSHNRGDEYCYADLWLMAQCKHFIIANSTFSWWGAWLSPHKQKIVVAPAMAQSGISSWGFKGLIPPEWIQI